MHALLFLLLVLLINDGECVVEGPFKRLLVESHQLGFALAMDRMADRRECVARHEESKFEMNVCVCVYVCVCVDDDVLSGNGWDGCLRSSDRWTTMRV